MPAQKIVLIGFLLFSSLFLFLNINNVNSSSDGAAITPEVQWSNNVEGVLSYCVYEGIVTLDSVNDPQAFCVIPTDDEPFESMHVNVNDDRDMYKLETIRLPDDVFVEKYSVCVTFSPSSPQEAGFNIAERCQTFNFEDENRNEEPLINLDEGAVPTTDGISMKKEEINPATNLTINSLKREDSNEINNAELSPKSINNTSNMTIKEQDNLNTQVNKTVEGNSTVSQLPITGITNQF